MLHTATHGASQPLHYFPTLLTEDEVVQVHDFINKLIARRPNTQSPTLCSPIQSPQASQPQSCSAFYIGSESEDEDGIPDAST